MGFSSGLRRFIRQHPATIKASAAETASTNGATVELGDASSIALTLAVTVVSGTTPTLSVALQTSDDAVNWYTVGTFYNGGFQFAGVAAGANITAAITLYAVAPVARYVRYASTIGGTTPSFTYSLIGSAFGQGQKGQA